MPEPDHDIRPAATPHNASPKIITIVPAAQGWSVLCDGVENGLVFKQGSKAELAARRLAKALSRAGETVELRIILRDGRLHAALPVVADEQP